MVLDNNYILYAVIYALEVNMDWAIRDLTPPNCAAKLQQFSDI